MMNPEGYTVYFRSRTSESRNAATSLVSRVNDMILEDEQFADFTVGMAEGCLVTAINWRGRVCSRPLGGAVDAAFRNQKGKKELQEY